MSCRICKTNNLVDVIDLGYQTITSRFPRYGDFTTPKTYICLSQCSECGLVQLKNLVDSHELYEGTYGYRSGLNEIMRNHLSQYNREIQSIIDLKPGDSVLDIGSNDATFLDVYPSFLRKVGCDPTGKQFASFYKNIELVPTYFSSSAVPHYSYKVVSSISMFYDLPDPIQFAKDVFSVLDDEGIWTLEQSYILSMLEQNSIDTICHEHVEYYALRQIKRIMDEAGFKIIRISENGCNGGSFRIYAAKRSSLSWKEDTEEIQRYLERENAAKLNDINTYKKFIENCNTEITKLKDFLHKNPNTYIYGASTKGNCFLQYANIGEDTIQFAVERNPEKIGCMTSTGIKIISEETMRINPPDYLLVLPWHFRDGIIKRESVFLKNGGGLVFGLPRFDVVKSHA